MTSEHPIGHPESLADAELHEPLVVAKVGGERAFRRRLLELGVIPGTAVTLEKIAPLGDPLELSVRGCTLSIRRADAQQILVKRG